MKLSRQKLFIIIAAVYFSLLLAVPAFMVIRHYHILKTGTIYKFIVEPYDPYDPFRGRYVEIRSTVIENIKSSPYSLLSTDENGFAYISDTQNEKPNDPNIHYVKNLEIKRYYLNEKIAASVEDLQRNLSENQTMYVQTAVKNGRYVIEGLYVDGIAVEKIFR